MKTFFEELFSYNRMVNQKMIEAVLENKDKVTPRTIQVMSHILLAHQSWNNRMLGKAGLSDFWQPVPLETMDSADSANLSLSLEIINIHDLDDTFSYQNSKGAEFKNTFRDVLFHLINHSSYHRGQVNANLRTAGAEPVITEYIFYKR